MKHKIKTWLRHKKRLLVMYLTEFYYYFEWPIRFFINYLIFFSIPLWAGPAYMLMMIAKAVQSRKNSERGVFSGRIWFWEMYKMW